MSDKLFAKFATQTTHNKKQENNIRALSGIRTRSPINQAAAVLRRGQRSHRDCKGFSFTTKRI